MSARAAQQPLVQSQIPVVTMAPPPGYTLHQFLPLEPLVATLDAADVDLLIRHIVFRHGAQERVIERTLRLRGGAWENPGDADLELASSIDDAEWRDGSDVPFLETHIQLGGADGFNTIYGPSFYTVFDSPTYKSFFNDNALKYANYVVIDQIRAFGNWVEGYPACAVDPANDIDESVLLINPHSRPAVVTLDFEGLDIAVRRRIAARSAQRLGFADLLPADALPWSGQAFVSGPNRVNLFFVSHSHANPADITTAEHSEVYRGEDAYVPLAQRPLQRLYRWKRGARR